MFDVGFQEIVLLSPSSGLLVLGPQRVAESRRRDRQVGRSRAAHGDAAAPPARARDRAQRARNAAPAARRRPAATPTRRLRRRNLRTQQPPSKPLPADDAPAPAAAERPDVGSRRRRRHSAGAARAGQAAESDEQPPDNHEPEKEELAEGTLMSHLLELRSRLMKAVLAVLVVFLVPHPFMNRVFESCRSRCARSLPEGRR